MLVACLVSLPIIGGLLLELYPGNVWIKMELYPRHSYEYGEVQRKNRSVKTRWNAWTSLSYYYAGIYCLTSGAHPCDSDGPFSWRIAIACALCWTGVASALFHASLTERWRAFDAGATMGITSFPTAFAIYRSLRQLDLQNELLSPYPFLALGMLGFLTCHVLAVTPGWSDSVLGSTLLTQAILEWGVLGHYKTDDDVRCWSLYLIFMLLGVVLRALDVKRGLIPSPVNHVVWLGHSAWHILTSVAIVMLIDAGTVASESYCHTPPEVAVRVIEIDADLEYLKKSWRRGEWKLLPPYPYGHAQIEDHEPWCVESLVLIAVSFVSCRALRHVVSRFTVPLSRFSEIVFFTVVHVLFVSFALIFLWDELMTMHSEPRRWFDFRQPALSVTLSRFYLSQIGWNFEAFAHMLSGALAGRSRDGFMALHHLATVSVLLAAWRYGFARVGVFVLLLHDASDIPIDAMRISLHLGWKKCTYVSVALVIISWSVLRLYIFPTTVIYTAIFSTHQMWMAYGKAGLGAADLQIVLGYSVYLAPLCILWCLSVYWFGAILGKVMREISGSKESKIKKR